MKIRIGDNHFLNSDAYSCWITAEVQGEDAKKPYEKRVSGYKATFEEAVESFIDRYVGESTAKDFKALVDDINDLKKEVRSWRDADVHM